MARFVGTVVKQRSVLWGALAALVIGAGVLVVGLGGGSDDGGGDDAPLLRLAAGGAGAGDARAEAAADAPAIGLATVYVPGDDLPELGGEAPAYRLAGEVTADDVRDLADALGIDAEPTETDPAGGSWHVEDGEMALDVYGPDGSWSAYRMVGDPMANPAARDAAAAAESTSSDPGSGGGTSGSTGAATPQNLVGGPTASGQTCPGTEPGADNVVDLCDSPPPQCPSGPATDPPLGCEPICLDQPDVATDARTCEPPPCEPMSCSPSPPCPGDPATDTRCMPTPTTPTPTDPADPAPPPDPTAPPTTVPPTTVPPADLPGEDEARAAAVDLLAATGAEVDGAEVTAENLVSMWSISVEPNVGDRPAPGLAMYVGIGDEGRVESATGHLTEPDELGDYPLIDTRAAIARLNEGWGFAAPPGDVTSAAAAESSTNVADDEIAGSAPPETGSAPGGGPVLTIEPQPPVDPDQPVSDQPGTVPPTEPAPPPEPDEVEVSDAEIVLVTVPSWDENGTYLVPGYRFTAADQSQPTVPAVTDDVLEPPPASPAEGESGAGDRVEIQLYHCGFEELRHGDQRWVVEDPPFDGTNAPPELVGKGTFVVDAGGERAVYTDDSGIAVTFTAVGEDWEPPICE